MGYTPETEEKLAYVLNTTVAAFHGGDAPSLASGLHPAHRSIPVIPYERAKALLNHETSYTPEELKDAVTTEFEVGVGSFALRVRDNMMAPLFRPGDLVLVDPQKPPSPGDFVVAAVTPTEAPSSRSRPRIRTTLPGGLMSTKSS